jgi:DNA-binding NtrC family response regulator
MLGVLIGDSDIRARRTAVSRFREAGHQVLEASDGAVALELVRDRSFDVVVCDLGLPRVDGLTVFRHVRRESPGTAVIVTAATPSIEDAVLALKEGATDFLVKPFDLDALLHGSVARIAERRALKTAFDEARAQLVGRIVGAALIGDSPPMRRLLERLDGVAQTESAVLITGESGTGKDIVARTVYARSRRAARPFVTVDCTRSADAIEEDLFGQGQQLAASRGGTLFFDEVAELPDRVQVRVARALRDSSGSPPRVISATHHDLLARIGAGYFREELYFLLNTVDLLVPPLRERKSDLALLVHHFLERLTLPGLVPPGVSPHAWEALKAYSYPGNVRELARGIEHAMALAHGCEISPEHLPAEITGDGEVGPDRESGDSLVPLTVARRRFERDYLNQAITLCDGDVARAAGMLRITPEALARKLRGAHERRSSRREHAVLPRALGPVKASVRPRDELGAAAAVGDLVEAGDAHAQRDPKLRAGSADR